MDFSGEVLHSWKISVNVQCFRDSFHFRKIYGTVVLKGSIKGQKELDVLFTIPFGGFTEVCYPHVVEDVVLFVSCKNRIGGFQQLSFISNRGRGADFVGDMDMVEKIQKENWFDFDVVVASPDMMGVVGRLGKLLGPKGLMPSPKAGTVTPDVAKAVKEVKAGKVEYRLDKTNIIHCPIGKVSFGADKLFENYSALIGAIIKAKPAAAKGQYIKSCVAASTMGPGVKMNANKQL